MKIWLTNQAEAENNKKIGHARERKKNILKGLKTIREKKIERKEQEETKRLTNQSKENVRTSL